MFLFLVGVLRRLVRRLRRRLLVLLLTIFGRKVPRRLSCRLYLVGTYMVLTRGTGCRGLLLLFLF